MLLGNKQGNYLAIGNNDQIEMQPSLLSVRERKTIVAVVSASWKLLIPILDNR